MNKDEYCCFIDMCIMLVSKHDRHFKSDLHRILIENIFYEQNNYYVHEIKL